MRFALNPGSGVAAEGREVSADDSADTLGRRPLGEPATSMQSDGSQGARVWRVKRRPSQRKHRRIKQLFMVSGAALLVTFTAGFWLTLRANHISDELKSAEAMFAEFEATVVSHDTPQATKVLAKIAEHTGAARDAVEDPIWKLASNLPVVGTNFSVVREVSVAADDIVAGAANPLLKVLDSLDWTDLAPVDGKFNVKPLEASAPTILAAAKTVELSYERLHTIDKSTLLPQVAQPLTKITDKLDTYRASLRTAADVSQILPSMMGGDGARNYLVLIQNNAEIRATGGLPGAVAVIRVDDGHVEFVNQSSGSAVGQFSPPVKVDSSQVQIYSSRLGKFFGDINLTPDFPTTAQAAKSMWEARHDNSVDGVVAIDPVVLAHILEASGPMHLSGSGPANDLSALPTTLTSTNVVSTLLSDVYRILESNQEQDEYFATASRNIFEALASGQAEGPALLKALSRSFEENRIHVWSDHNDDQMILGETPLGGSVLGPSAGGTAFGVYFNDGTGAKMDYYMRRTVQLVRVCTSNGYAEYKVKIKAMNTAPANAATSLPVSVTGDGRFGTPPGSVQTNVVVYGPAMSHVDMATRDGEKASVASHLHGNRPVGVVTTRLAPGQSSELEIGFVRVAQHGAPVLSVTPTVQDVKDVMLPTEAHNCN